MHSICLFFCSITRIDKTLQITRCFDTEAVIIWLVLSTCFYQFFLRIWYIFNILMLIRCMLLWYNCKDKIYTYWSIRLYFIQIQLHIIFSWLGNLQNLLVFICKSKAKNTWKFELLPQSIRISMNGKIFCPYFRIVLSCKYKMMGNMIYQRFVSNIYYLPM